MKKRLFCLLLCLSLALTGCASPDFSGFFGALRGLFGASGTDEITPYSEMEYSRPSLTELETILAQAQEDSENGDADAVLNDVYDFYEAYDVFYTNYALSDILYSGDLTNETYAEEYAYCLDTASQVDEMLDELYRILAAGECREALESDYFGEGFFDDYDGESVYSDEYLALLQQESELQSEYYALYDVLYEDADDPYAACWEDMAEVLAQLVSVRKAEAESLGYSDYVTFAYEVLYGREYTPAQAAEYVEQIREKLVPLYVGLDGSAWDAAGVYASEEETFDEVRAAAEKMGSTVWEAFEVLEEGGLYDIAYSENKYDSSFEIYLNSYYVPFVFMNPTLTRYDSLTLAHEFGHFCNDYASYGAYAGVDVAEIFSQGMEYLLLCYGEDTASLTTLKLADSLSTYVEQSFYDAFEEALYALPESELTPDGIRALYAEKAAAFGIDTAVFDDRDFVAVTHFYTNPLYIISYVTSNDAAMQLYEMELANEGDGLACLEENLDTEYWELLSFLDSAGLAEPFDRVDEVCALFTRYLGE